MNGGDFESETYSNLLELNPEFLTPRPFGDGKSDIYGAGSREPAGSSITYRSISARPEYDTVRLY
jgi:hypothetical protein